MIWNNLKNKKQKDDLMLSKTMNNRIRELRDKDKFMLTIQEVTHNNVSPSKRNQILMDNSINLKISPIKQNKESKSF